MSTNLSDYGMGVANLNINTSQGVGSARSGEKKRGEGKGQERVKWIMPQL